MSTVDKALRNQPVLEEFPPLVPAGRIPLTIAAHGRRALETAARHGDRWVSYGGFGLDEPAHLARTRRRVAVLDGLPPVRKMLLAGSPAVTATPIWSSVQAVADFTGRYREAGIDEFTFYYPPSALWPTPGADEVFEEFVSGQ